MKLKEGRFGLDVRKKLFTHTLAVLPREVVAAHLWKHSGLALIGP